MSDSLQNLCERGQQLLMQMEYLQAERTLAQAEAIAWNARDWDSLARLYMPLQECRRQRRQRSGEGIIRLDVLANGADERIDPRQLINQYPHGQLLIAGWGSIAPAVEFRRLQAERDLYVETFLGAVYDTPAGRVLLIVPRETDSIPASRQWNLDDLRNAAPPHAIVLRAGELPTGQRRGNSTTYGRTMGLWEQLHVPFLRQADAQSDPIQRMHAYRTTLTVDYACELAHQKLSTEAKACTHSF